MFHIHIHPQSGFRLSASRIASDHSVPVEDGWLGNKVEQLVGMMHDAIVMESIQGENPAGDVGEAGEAESDRMSMDLFKFLRARPPFEHGEQWGMREGSIGEEAPSHADGGR